MKMKTLAGLSIGLLLSFAWGCSGAKGPIVLNERSGEAEMSEEAMLTLPAELRSSASLLTALYVDGNRVDYEGLAASEEFAEYRRLAQSLNDFDLSLLKTRGEKLAFWINLYNAAILHATLESGVEESVREQADFFDRYAYRVGGLTFTPNQIEHGVLRGDLEASDPRAAHAVLPIEPRLHFALNCASKSCPPIHVYTAEEIEPQLDLATRFFLNQETEARVDIANNAVYLTQLFDWYAADFEEGVLPFVLRHLDDSPQRDYLEKRLRAIDIRYNDYDWSLNR